MNASTLRHKARYAMRCACVAPTWHQAIATSPYALVKQQPRYCVREPGSLPAHQSGMLLELGGTPVLGICPSRTLAAPVLALFRLLSCTSPGHHASLISVLRRLQRRWRSFWRYSRNRITMAWTPLSAGHSTPGASPLCQSHSASAAT